MANEVTIDELQIEISAESGSAAGNIDKLAQSLDRLQAVTQRMTSGGEGLNKVARQMEKLNSISERVQNMQGFDKIGKAVEQLKKLNELNGAGDISPFIRNLNKLPQAISAVAQMPPLDTAKFQQLADTLKPLETISAGNINSLINSLRKLPKASQELAAVDFNAFSRQIEQTAQAIEPLANRAQSAGAGLTALAQIMQQTNRTAGQSSDGLSLFDRTLGSIKVKTLAAGAVLRRLFSALKSGVSASAAYVENLNLFSVTMGESADEALKFAEAVNAALGVDTSDWIRYQGVFQSIGKGFGIVSEKADVMSKNLTQLTYDISSFYNISADTAAEKLQSALSGQVMPMRSLGFAIEETTLKQVALNHGIEASVESMTQAQKAQLRYVAIMEQAGNIGVLGDMARTIDTAANGLRVLQARLQQFARAVGNMVMPVLSAVLPYLTAFVQLLTEGAQKIADFFGFELPKIDFSGASVTSGFDDIASSAEEATAASEKFKGSLAGIDQLNIIGSKDDGSSGSGAENKLDLGIELPEYDFLQGLESKTQQLVEDIKAVMPWLGAFAAAVAAAFAVKHIGNFITGLSNVKTAFGNLLGEKATGAAKLISGIAGGLAAGAASGVLFYNSIKNLITGTGKLSNNIAMLAAGVGIAGGVIAAFVKTGNPVGAVITGIGAAVGIFAGIIAANKENMEKFNEELNNTIMYSDNGGIAIQGLTDGFKGYFDSVTNGYDDILANTAAFRDNEEKISSAAEEINNLADKYTALNQTITTEDAGKIADAVKTIGDGISSSLGTATQGIVSSLKDTFHDFALGLGKDVDDMVTKFYLLESMGNSSLAATRQRADELAASLQSGNLTVQEQKQAFDELQTTIKAMGTSDVGTKEQMSFERAVQEMSTAKINFDKPGEAENQINELNSLAEQARSSITTAYDEQTYQLEQMKRRYETMTDLKTGLTVKQAYDRSMGSGAFDKLFADTQEIYDKAKEGNLTKIDTGQAVYLSMLQNQLNENKQSYVDQKYAEKGASLKGGWNAWWRNGLFISSEDVKAESRAGYEKEFEQLNSALYDTVGGALAGLNLTPEAMEAARMITDGLAGGALEGQDDFYNALNAVANGGLDEVRNVCEIHSPSKKFAELGEYMMQGLQLGIERSSVVVIGALDTLLERIIKQQERIKKQCEKYDLSNFSSEDFIPDFGGSYELSASGVAAGAVGAAREAYSSAARSANAENGGVPVDINVNLQSYIELDGEQVGQAVSQYQERQMAYSNGR